MPMAGGIANTRASHASIMASTSSSMNNTINHTHYTSTHNANTNGDHGDDADYDDNGAAGHVYDSDDDDDGDDDGDDGGDVSFVSESRGHSLQPLYPGAIAALKDTWATVSAGQRKHLGNTGQTQGLAPRARATAAFTAW